MAIELPAEKRDAFIDDACGEDGALKEQILRLLQLDRSSFSVFETPLINISSIDEHVAKGEESRATRLINCVVGGCRILRLIGLGGMGLVYEAEQLSTGRIVAVKLIDDLRMSKRILWRFKREIEVLSRFDHPGVARLYDAGFFKHNGVDRPYFVMELITGSKSIIEYSNEHKLSLRDRLTLFCEACDAVTSGHQCGIVHRDLKPGNILVNGDGQPKVIDFGVAGALEGNDLGLEQTINREHVVGSLHTIAPEQFNVNESVPDVRSDVYSLGVVLFELATGKTPIEVKSSSLVSAAKEIAQTVPYRASQFQPDVGGDFDSICAMALTKDPDARYQSVADLAEDVQRYIAGQPVHARSAERWYQMRCLIRRSWMAIAITLSILAALLLATLTYKNLYSETKTQKLQLEKSSEALRISNYHNLIALAESALKSENLIEARALLEQCPEDLRRWEWHYLYARLDDSVKQINLPDGLLPYRMSPDGTLFAGASLDKITAFVANSETGETLWNRSYGSDLIDTVCWSEDGSAVAFGRRTGSSVIVEAKSSNVLLELPNATCVSREFSLINTLIYSTRNTAYARPMDSVEPDKKLFSSNSLLSSLRADPSGKYIAAGWHNGMLTVYDRTKHSVVFETQAHTDILSYIEFTGDLTMLATSGWDGHVHVWDLHTGERLRTLTPVQSYRPSLCLSDSNTLIAYSNRGTVILCDFDNGDEVIRLRGFDTKIGEIRFADDEQRITAISETELKTWDLNDMGAFQLKPSGHTGWIDFLTYSNSGELLATSGREGTIFIRDSSSNDIVACDDTLLSRIVWLGFTPDDAYLVGRTVDGQIHIWGVPALNPIVSCNTQGGWFAFGAWLDDRKLLTPGPNDELLTISIPDGDILDRLNTSQEAMRAVAISDDKSILITSTDQISGETPGAIVWQRQDDTFQQRLTLLPGQPVFSVLCSPDINFVITGGLDGDIRVWDLETGNDRLAMKGHQDFIYWLEFLEGGARVVSSEYPGGIRVWDTQTGRALLDLPRSGSRFDIQPKTNCIASDLSPFIALHTGSQ